MDSTDRFNLAKLGPGDSLQSDGYKFSSADRDLLDRALEYALEQHVHDGAAAANDAPEAAPVLTLHTTGGTIPAGARAHYKYAYVDAHGNETAASPMSFVDTPAAVATPASPVLAADEEGGTLPPGTYTYVVSAYASATTLETRPSVPVLVRLNTLTSTGLVTITMPSTPTGATGWNIYRRKPGATRLYFLGSTTASSYVDDGSVPDDTSRTTSNVNTTNNLNSVTIGLPGATPAVPAGKTWRVYRSLSSIDWSNTLLHWVVETVEEDSGPVVTDYDDVGESTTVGAPLQTSQSFGSPPKIVLTDMANVTGTLPPGRNTVAHVVTFRFPDLVFTQTGLDLWVCNFSRADVLACRAYLGRGSTPASQDVIVDVNKYDAHGATPGWATIYTTQANRPRVPVGEFLGTSTTPDVVRLLQGDVLSVDIDQAGGGATPTDQNLCVDVLMYVQHGSASTTYSFGT